MYMHTPAERQGMAALENQLNGFNPLKAIGRALGGTGRAIVGALVPGGQIVSSVLDTAARSPAKSGAAIAQAINTALAPAQPATPSATPAANIPAATTTTLPRQRDPAKFAERMAMMKMMASAPQAAPSGGGGSPSIVVSAPASQPSAAPAASALPPWAIPAAIGAAGLLFVLSQKKGR